MYNILRKKCYHTANKVLSNAEVALKEVRSGQKIIFGGFGLCGIPENMIRVLVERDDIKNLEIVSDNGGTSYFGIGQLMGQKKVKKMYASFIGQNPIFLKKVTLEETWN